MKFENYDFRKEADLYILKTCCGKEFSVKGLEETLYTFIENAENEKCFIKPIFHAEMKYSEKHILGFAVEGVNFNRLFGEKSANYHDSIFGIYKSKYFFNNRKCRKEAANLVDLLHSYILNTRTAKYVLIAEFYGEIEPKEKKLIKIINQGINCRRDRVSSK